MIGKTWRYKLDSARCLRVALPARISFKNEWVEIDCGSITVSAGYAWDGCSPAHRIPGTHFWIGVPDGTLRANGRPVAWEASLFHDVLCQFRREIPGLRRRDATRVFVGRLKSAGAPWLMSWLYGIGANLLGPQDFRGGL